ncbi:MAG: hypothetical protein MUD10_02825 [Candidatus Pacebacteria bacterium]|jgi:hypothetical protein|nr:hypothetical protein [Candidatus Paceibacterota bacterium]
MGKNFFNEGDKGYIALLSSIIISLVMTCLAFTAARAGFYSRFDSLNGEYKRVSKGLAESCVNHALLELSQNPNYPGAETDFVVGFGHCDIAPIFFDPSFGFDAGHKKIAVINTNADYKGSYSKLQVDLEIYDPQYALPVGVEQNIIITSWREK